MAGRGDFGQKPTGRQLYHVARAAKGAIPFKFAIREFIGLRVGVGFNDAHANRFAGGEWMRQIALDNDAVVGSG